MKEYLKMADVFGGAEVRIRKDAPSLVDCCGVLAANCLCPETAWHIAHAINSHDELVENMQHYKQEAEKWEARAVKEASMVQEFDLEVERLRSTLQQCVDALYIADKFCGNHTADECDDAIAIPISDALVAASKIVAPSNLGVTND